MSYEQYFKTEIQLREFYHSIYHLQDEIDDLNKMINNVEAEIKMFASSNPKDIIPDEWKEEQPIDWLNMELNNKFDSYNEFIIKKFKLELYMEYLKENNITHIEPEKDDFGTKEKIDKINDEEVPF